MTVWLVKGAQGTRAGSQGLGHRVIVVGHSCGIQDARYAQGAMEDWSKDSIRLVSDSLNRS